MNDNIETKRNELMDLESALDKILDMDEGKLLMNHIRVSRDYAISLLKNCTEKEFRFHQGMIKSFEYILTLKEATSQKINRLTRKDDELEELKIASI